MNVFTLMAQLDLNSDKFTQGLDKAEQRGQGFGKKFGGAMKTAGTAALGITGAVAGAGAAALAAGNKFAAQADKIDESSKRVGVSAEDYQEMTFALSELGGVSEQTAERGIGRLNQRMGRAAEGNEKYQKALEAVGISMEDIRNGTIDASDAMDIAVQNLGEMDDSTERAAIAGELFGTKVGRDLLPVLGEGGEAFRDMRDSAHEMGAVMSDEGIAAGTEFSAQMSEVQNMLGAVWREIMMELMPILNDFLGWVREHMPAIKAFVSDAMEGMSAAWENTLKPAFQAIQPIVEALLPILKSLVENGFQVIAGIIRTVANLLQGDLSGAFNAFHDVVQGLVMFVGDVASAILGGFVDTIRGGISRIVSVGQAIFDAIWDAISFLPRRVMSLGGDMIGDLIQGIRNSLSGLRSAAGDIFNAIWDEISGLPGRVAEMAGNLVGGLVDGIGDRVDEAKEAVTGLFSGIFGRAEEEAEIESPSKVMYRYGGNLVAGLVNGIDDNAHKAEKAAERLAWKARAGFGEGMKGFQESMADKFGGTGFGGATIDMDLESLKEQRERLKDRMLDFTARATGMGANVNMMLRRMYEARLEQLNELIQQALRAQDVSSPVTGAGPADRRTVSVSTDWPSAPDPTSIERSERLRSRNVRMEQRAVETLTRAADQFSADVQRLSLANLRY